MNKYNILTCDDEQIMIDSLKFIITKNFEGQVNLFSALSGTEAIETVSKNHIDIIFMDINMIGMNGLDTIRCINNINTDCVIIVLSAFDKFQYAQEAMNLGAYKYITKPVNRNIVIQTVRNAMNLIDSKREKTSDSGELQKKLDIVSPMVESDFIYSCIFNSDKEDLKTYLDYFSIDFEKYFIMCFEIPKVDSKNQMDIYTKIREQLHNKFICLMGNFMANRIVAFIPMDSNAIAQDAYQSLCFNVTRGIRCGVSRISESLENVSTCYNEALFALNSTSPNGELLFADNIITGSPETKLNDLKERILNRLKLGDTAGVQFLSKNYCTRLIEENKDINIVKSSIFEFLVNAKELTRQTKEDFDSSSFDNIFGFLMSANTKEQLEDYFSSRLAECSCAIAGSRDQKENPLIKKVCEFIEANLANDISLEDAASVAKVSSFYLSKLFKDETGETFVNYLTEKRLDKAKNLLNNKNYSIKEVAAECGYNDQNYFSRLFKNKFGISPSDFRSIN